MNQQASSHYRSTEKRREWSIVDAWIEQDECETTRVNGAQPLSILLRIGGMASQRVAVEFILRDQNHYPVLFCPSGLAFGCDLQLREGIYLVKLDLNLPPLANGRYYVDLMLADSGRRFFDKTESAIYFDVVGGFASGWIFRQEMGQGALTLPRDSIRIECNAEAEMIPSLDPLSDH